MSEKTVNDMALLSIQHTIDTIARLETENEKLKQALEHSMNYMSESAQAEVNMIARGES